MQDHASDEANGADTDLAVLTPVVGSFYNWTVKQKSGQREG